MRVRSGWVRNERGATLALVAVVIVGMLAAMALAVDWGMYVKDRAEAQRAADAAALAGASQFLKYAPLLAVIPAHGEAMISASYNTIHKTFIDTLTEVTVQVIPDTAKVRVWVRRPFVRSLFAKVFNVFGVNIGAKAAAVAASTGVAPCVKPFAVPDAWDERFLGRNKETGDINGNHVWEPNENWAFDTAAVAPQLPDRYLPYDPNVIDPTQTGYGSSWRDNIGTNADLGRQMVIKAQSPSGALGSGFFYPWRLPGGQGAQFYKDNIMGCNPAQVSTGTPYDVEMGNMVGPTRQAIDSLIATDPNATWNSSLNTIQGWDQAAYGTDWRNSPRVIKVGLFDPHQIIDIHDGGHTDITFNNFALLFVEGFQGSGNQVPLIARFLYFASGTGGPGGGPATLVKVLQLVE